MEGDGGACEVPAPGSCWVADSGGGEVGYGPVVVVAEEGSTGGGSGELGVRSGRKE